MPSSRSWTPRSERSVSKTAELEVKLQQAVDLRLSRRRGPESSEDLSSEGGQTTRGALSSCTSWESRSLTSRSSTSSTASLSQPARAGPWHCATSVQGRVRTHQSYAVELDVVQEINRAELALQGGKRSLWASFSRTPAERGRASVAGCIKKVVAHHRPGHLGDLDLDYGAGAAWMGETQLAGDSPAWALRRALPLPRSRPGWPGLD